MCGIAGIIGSADDKALRRMVAAMRRRGPDDEGFLIEPPVPLGMRRLEIIDRSGGRQPMASGTATAVYDGEITNFRELRADLAGRGRRFRTQSDTEVLLQAYEEWGDECVRRFRGMFAFALYDARRRAVLLVR